MHMESAEVDWPPPDPDIRTLARLGPPGLVSSTAVSASNFLAAGRIFLTTRLLGQNTVTVPHTAPSPNTESSLQRGRGARHETPQ